MAETISPFRAFLSLVCVGVMTVVSTGEAAAGHLLAMSLRECSIY